MSVMLVASYYQEHCLSECHVPCLTSQEVGMEQKVVVSMLRDNGFLKIGDAGPRTYLQPHK